MAYPNPSIFDDNLVAGLNPNRTMRAFVVGQATKLGVGVGPATMMAKRSSSYSRERLR